MTKYYCNECDNEIWDSDIEASEEEGFDYSYCYSCREKLARQEEERLRDLRNDYLNSV